MTLRTYRHLPRAGWLPGPWLTEPDRVEWVDEATRLPCLVLRREGLGHLCGYVGVPPDHPAHGLNYDGITQAETDEKRRRWDEMMERQRDLREKGLDFEEAMKAAMHGGTPFDPKPVGAGELVAELRAHGGLTFAGPRQGYKALDGVGFVREDLADTDWWFFGFDCAHAFDATGFAAPMAFLLASLQVGEYRDVTYVMDECSDLAAQLALIDGKKVVSTKAAKRAQNEAAAPRQ